MAKATAQISTATTKTKVLSPLKLYQTLYCNKCQGQCDPNSKTFQNCILAHIADNLTLIRKTLDQRTRHLSW